MMDNTNTDGTTSWFINKHSWYKLPLDLVEYCKDIEANKVSTLRQLHITLDKNAKPDKTNMITKNFNNKDLTYFLAVDDTVINK